MASFLKMATFAIILHIVFYVALNLVLVPDTSGDALPNTFVSLGTELEAFKIEPDLMDIFLSNDLDEYTVSIKDNWTEYPNLNQTVISVPSKVGGEALGTNVVSFLDPLNMVWASFNTLLNIGASPIAILSSNKVHPIVWLLIGLPYIIVMWITVLALVRGVGD